MTISKKFTLVIMGIIAAVGFLLVLVYAAYKAGYLSEQADTEAQYLRQDIERQLRLTDNLMNARLHNAMALLKREGLALGVPAQGSAVTVKGRKAPDLLLGDASQANNHRLVDSVTEIMGGTATLFSRQGNEFVRVTTNVMTNGQRAIGTILDPDGAAITAIQRGEAFYGQVDILGTPFLTGYEPIRDERNQVIGIWYVGYPADLDVLAESMASRRLQDNGFVALRDDHGRLRLHSRHVGNEQMESVLTDQASGWRVESTDFEAWGYEIFSAFPEADLRARVRSDVVAMLLAVVLIGGLLAGIIVLMLRRIVGKPLATTIDRMEEIAEGELSVRLDDNRRDELGSMARSFNHMLERLQATLTDISTGASQLTASSEELATVAVDSNKAITAQTEETEQVATAMNQMSATVAEVAKSTEQAAVAAKDARQQADNGVVVVGETITSIESLASDVERAAAVIGELSAASSDISQVLGVITDIADQTNLLALNAAIEAARAGEHGRGFAVVADEVRSLASRTQQSTEEINTMIARIQSESTRAVEVMEQGQKTAEHSVRNAQSSRASLDSILEAVKRINELNTEVASAAEEQTAVAEEVNRNLGNIRDAAEQNRSNSDHSMRASDELSRLASSVQDRIGYFKV